MKTGRDLTHHTEGVTKMLTPYERLIVAADFDGSKAENITRIEDLSHALKGTGVCVKLNADIRGNYWLIDTLHDHGLKVFVDLKLNDIPSTLARDGKHLLEYKPELLTVMCSAGKAAIEALVLELPQTEVLGVTVLTSLTDDTCEEIYGNNVKQSVLKLAGIGLNGGVRGLVASPHEAGMLRSTFPLKTFSINTPNIRPSDVVVKQDDQNPNRTMTAPEAIRAGADRVIVGRPITKAEIPYGAAMRILEEIESVCS